MIKLGDFFSSAPYARPVNPKPVTFTAIAKGPFLPGNVPNQSGRPVAATITAALVFVAGDAIGAASGEARSLLRRLYEDQKIFQPIDDDDFNREMTYQIVWRALYEWDEQEKRIGDHMFPTVDVLREMVVVPEANRIMREYNKYVAEEHPEHVTEDGFQGAESGGQGLARAAPRR